MIIKDVVLSRVEVLSAKTFLGLLEVHEPGCSGSWEGVKQRPYDYAYQLRFLLDEDCLAARQFPTDDMIGADFVIEDEE